MGDQDVLGFDVLMEHADRMRRQRVGDLGDQLDAGLSRNRFESALLLGPGGQVTALGMLDLEKKGRTVEVPIEHAGDIVAVAERLLEHSKNRHFALQGT